MVAEAGGDSTHVGTTGTANGTCIGNGVKSGLVMIEDDNTLFRKKLRLWKNNLGVCVSFMLLFLGFMGLTSLQSSLHRDGGLGVINQAVLYTTLVLSCMFLPPIVISKLGWKWSLAISETGYVLWMAANMYATWGTMIPASIIVGTTASLVWAAQSSYTTECGVRMAALTGERPDDVISKFFGVFIMFFQSSQVWGNLISSLVLSNRPMNASDVTEEDLLKCGRNFCPRGAEDGNGTSAGLEPPSQDLVWTLVGIYLGLGVLAILCVVFFLDNIKKEDEKKKGISVELLIATFKLNRDRKQLLLLPLTTYVGMSPAFLMAEFTKAYVACSLGIWNVGFVMLCYGAASTVCSLLAGYSAKKIGRVTLVMAAFAIQLAMLVTLACWMPHFKQAYVMYIIAALWGIGDANLMSQSNTLYGVIFKDNCDAAFSNYRLWNSIGFIIVFLCSDFICVDIKIYIVMVVLLLSIPTYLITERMARKEARLAAEGEKYPYEHEQLKHKANDRMELSKHPTNDSI